MIDNPTLKAAEAGYRQIYLEGIPFLLRQNETAFLAFLSMAAGIDTLSGYRYQDINHEKRFQSFINEYFPPQYGPHAQNLYIFRCRMLHNSSPAHFTISHGTPSAHLYPSPIGDTVLNDQTFFDHFMDAADLFFRELNADPALQHGMLNRLQDLDRGGALWITT